MHGFAVLFCVVYRPRPALQCNVGATYCYRRSSVVCLSVCLSRSWFVRPAKTTEPLGTCTSVGPTNHVFVLDGVHIGATWWIRLNRPCALAMPYATLLWPLLLFLLLWQIRSVSGHATQFNTRWRREIIRSIADKHVQWFNNASARLPGLFIGFWPAVGVPYVFRYARPRGCATVVVKSTPRLWNTPAAAARGRAAWTEESFARGFGSAVIWCTSCMWLVADVVTRSEALATSVFGAV